MSSDAAEEARKVLAVDPQAKAYVSALVELLKKGDVKKGKDYREIKKIDGEPPLFELKIDQTKPRLRLFFIEESHDDGARATGLLLATKPAGSTDEARAAQNRLIDEAYARRPKM